VLLSGEQHQVGGTTVFADAESTGRHRQASRRTRRGRITVAVVVVAALLAIVGALATRTIWRHTDPPGLKLDRSPLPTVPASYIGIYREGVPSSYAVVSAFTTATGVRPDVVTYYSGWGEQFQAGFAASVAKHGAVTLVQINPFNVRLAAIASGRYDSYLTGFAEAVRSYRRPVILSFGHEMNGNWYSWGYRHASPAAFVAAWRHIVTLFRGLRVRNVTWMWTVNVIHKNRDIPSPEPWWPGSSYVNWVGMDGYYYDPSWTFASLFGPTIATVRELTRDPILIAETAAAPVTVQPTKIADLFAGVRLYGLLGFVWFDVSRTQHWSVSTPAAIAEFRRGAQTYHLPSP
jgi:mannan endo-1,4-beta-mannosidase